jgi:hypothetical protein
MKEPIKDELLGLITDVIGFSPIERISDMHGVDPTLVKPRCEIEFDSQYRHLARLQLRAAQDTHMAMIQRTFGIAYANRVPQPTKRGLAHKG